MTTLAGLTGTGRLVRLVLRRDRVRLSLWIGGLVGLMAVSAMQVDSLYRDPAALAGYAATVSDNPALVLFAGPGYGLDAPTAGAVLVNETSLWMALACAVMSVFVVNRHTRAEEESERADLLRSTVLGRHAPLAAALTVAVAADVAVGALGAAVSVAAGFDPTGSVALGASFAMVGVAFAAATAVAVQLAGTGRGAIGLGIAAAGVGFVVRGIGDIGAPALSWLTPYSWGIGVRAYAGERWWTLAGLLAGSAVTVALAVVLSTRRDLGSGMLPQRPGPATAGRWTTRPLGLTFRLQRGALAGWSAGVVLIAFVYGSVGDEIEQMLVDNPQLGDYLARLDGGDVTDLYFATALRVLTMLICGFAISSALRIRGEETAGYAESLLATPLSRWRWWGAHLVVTLGGSVVLVTLAGLGVGIGYASAIGDPTQVGRMLAAGLAWLPAVLVVVGFTTVLTGWAPRLAVGAWAGLVLVVVIGLFAQLLELPRWVLDLSPLEHVPAVPAVAWRTGPLLGLVGVAVLLGTAGYAGFRRRDLVTG